MKYHLISVVILIAAIILYGAGSGGLGTILFLVGAALETWFWVRTFRGKPHSATKTPPA
jgi:hypothetical protein